MNNLNGKTVLIITDNPFPPDPRIKRQTKALLKAGAKVVIFSLRYDKITPKIERNENLIIYRLYIKKFLANKLKASILRFSFYTNFISAQIKNAIIELNINIDVVQICDLPLSCIGENIKNKYYVPLIVDFREPYTCLLEDSIHTKKLFGNYFYNKELWSEYEQKILDTADAIICVNDESSKRFPSVYKEKMKIVPNCVDLEDFKDIKIKDMIKKIKKFRMIHFGGVSKIKGCQNVILNLHKLIKIIPNVEYVIVGNGKYLRELQNLAEKLRLNDHVTFKGWMNYYEGNCFLNEADVGMISDLRCSTNDFGDPNRLYQYMMMKKPVVATDCPPVERIIKDSDCGITYSDTKSGFVEAIDEIYNCPGKAKLYGENGNSSILNKYNWDIASKDYISIFNN